MVEKSGIAVILAIIILAVDLIMNAFFFNSLNINNQIIMIIWTFLILASCIFLAYYIPIKVISNLEENKYNLISKKIFKISSYVVSILALILVIFSIPTISSSVKILTKIILVYLIPFMILVYLIALVYLIIGYVKTQKEIRAMNKKKIISNIIILIALFCYLAYTFYTAISF